MSDEKDKPKDKPKPDMRGWDNPPKGELMFKTLDKKRIRTENIETK